MSAYHVLFDRNDNACIDEVSKINKSDSSDSKIAVLSDGYLRTIVQAITRARLVGRNPSEVALYHDGQFQSMISELSNPEDWDASNQLIYLFATKAAYRDSLAARNILIYFDDSEVASYHTVDKKERELNRDRYKRLGL